MRTPDGRDVSCKLESGEISAEVGHVISAINSGDWVMMYRNHTTGRHGVVPDHIDSANRLPGTWLWAASVIVALLGLMAVQRFVVAGGEHEGDWRFSYMVGSLTLLAALACSIYLGAIKRIVHGIRYRQFSRRYLPQLERFLEERTPLLEKHYRSP